MTGYVRQRGGSTVQHVIFDWNGTLIDDCGLAVATVNSLRDECGMPRITREQYRRAFRFPIREFYRSIGFDVDGDAFPALMARYLERFNAQVDDCALHAGTLDLLAGLRTAGVKVHILSASHRDTLSTSLRAKGLAELFDHIAGLGDALATTKHQLGTELAARLGSPPADVVYVGDTDHDYEVACAQGWKFLFVDHGHQLAASEAPHCSHTLRSLDEIFAHVQQETR
ncbi:MAG TPA: HAD family hydrolase [Kofleriaceae bacterium]|jgi:phosphoglycolate phosphatase|nr:HAD family hydrolase [Kofleriaceae bacterium]